MTSRYSDNDPSGYNKETMDRDGDDNRDGYGREDNDNSDGNVMRRGEDRPRDDDDDLEDDNDEDNDEDDGNDLKSKGDDDEEYDDEYYDEEAYREEDQIEKEEREDEGRSRCLYCALCCCCLLLIIAAIVIGILLSRKKKSQMVPTEAPTIFGASSFPTVPTGSSSVPPFVEGSPNGDTTVYKDGPLQNEPQGEEEIMLVQSGESQDPNFPDTYALMNWKWDEVGNPWFNEDDLADYDVAGMMCLEHVPNTNQGSNKNTTYSLCRLPSSYPGEELETSTSTGYKYIMPTDCMGQQKVDFDVAPNDETVCADVTPLINVHPPFVATGTSPDKRRELQENNFQNMLFMLDNINSEQRATDEFYTRQAGTSAPTLRLTMTPKSGGGGAGSGNGNGGTSTPPVSSGTGSSPATTPTISNAPSTSSAPSIYSGPTVSPAPTGNSTFLPCGVCGDGPAGAPLREDYEVSVPMDIAPDSIINGMASCAEIEEICLAGECNPQVCSGLAEVRQACGCPGAGGPTLCSICPAQTSMTRPDEDIGDVISPYVSAGMLDAAGDVVTCASFDELCKEGQCGSDVCQTIPNIVSEPCGCTPTAGSGPPSFPTGSAPTEAPTMSAAPTSSAAPTYKAEFEFCGICGVGPTPNPLTDVPIAIPEHLAPPQVKNGEATCTELESYCQEGYCRPLTCRVLEPIRGLCGCPNADPPCSICGAGKVISNTDAALNLDPAVAVPGYDLSLTCGELNDLCAAGFCDGSRCEQYPDIVTQTCGCTDTIPDLALFSSSDTTIYPNGTLSTDSFAGEDTMLVQGGLSDNEELPRAFSLVEFTVTDTDYQDVLRFGFATVELCLHHAVSAEADREMTYRACVVPNVNGGLGSANGETVDYSIPNSCAEGKVSQFTVSPSSERVCTIVTEMARDDISGPTTLTFMVDAADSSSDQPGDRFYTQEDIDGRVPTIQFVDRPYNVN
jgi:hypothetical protein